MKNHIYNIYNKLIRTRQNKPNYVVFNKFNIIITHRHELIIICRYSDGRVACLLSAVNFERNLFVLLGQENE